MDNELIKAFCALMPEDSDPSFYQGKALETAESALKMIADGCPAPENVARAALGDMEAAKLMIAACEEKNKP